MTELTADAVHELMKSVLYSNDRKDAEDGKVPADAIIVDGIVNKFGFDPVKIAAQKSKIDALLLELPDNFQVDKGGGWSFLNACEDRHGRLWGQHPTMEALICMGIAAGSAEWLMKEYAAQMPGGVPYVQVHVKEPAQVS